MVFVLIFVLVAIIIAMYIGIKNLIIQVEYFEERVDTYEAAFETVRQKVLDMDIELKELDIRGAFESDDEVGFVFKEIKELSSDLNKTVQTIYDQSRD